MKTVVGCGIVVENEKGEILLGKKRDGRIYPGCWVTPGGGLEVGESIDDMVRREAREETNLEIEIVERINFDDDFTWKISKEGIREDIHIVSLNYLVRVIGGELETKEDFTDATWFPKDKLKDLKHNPLSQRLFAKLGWL